MTANRLVMSSNAFEFILWFLLGMFLLFVVAVAQRVVKARHLRHDITRVLWDSFPISVGTEKLADKVIARKLAAAPLSMRSVYARKSWRELRIAFLGHDAELFFQQLGFMHDEGDIECTVVPEGKGSVPDILWTIPQVTTGRGPWGFRPQMMTNDGGG